MSNMGQLIVFEGVEGAGKSTVINQTEEYLQSNNIQCISYREPGGTPLGEILRSVLKDHQFKDSMAAKTELLLMYASRVQLIEEKIKPALLQGMWVLLDRFEWSTFAYQGAGRGLDKSIISQLSALVLAGFTADHIFFLDIEPTLTSERMQQRGAGLDRIESESSDFFMRIYREYQNLASLSDRCTVINARHNQDQVWSDVQTKLDNLLLVNHGCS